MFLRKRAAGEPASHADPDGSDTAPLAIEGADIPINRYFLNHPEMVLGTWSRKDRLYDAGYSVIGNGDLAEQLRDAIRPPARGRRPRRPHPSPAEQPAAAVHAPAAADRHITEGSFFVGDDRIIRQIDGRPGRARHLRRHAAQGRRHDDRQAARRPDRACATSPAACCSRRTRAGPRRTATTPAATSTAPTTASSPPTARSTRPPSAKPATARVIRRMPNLVKFREDPDAMLVMSLEDYDEVTGKAAKAAIMQKDVVGKTPPVTSRHHRRGRAAGLPRPPRRGRSALHRRRSTASPRRQVIAELGDLIYHDPESKAWQTADAYLSGNVRAKLAAAEQAGPDYARNAEALRAVQPEDVLPGDIDANLGAPWIPEADIQAFAAELFHVAAVGHPGRPPEERRGVERRRRITPPSSRSPPPPSTARRGPTASWLLELALNLKTPVIYDTDPERRPRGARRQPGGDAGRPREAEADQGEVPAPGSSPTPTAPSGWCGSTTTPTTTCGPGCSTARTSTSPA